MQSYYSSPEDTISRQSITHVADCAGMHLQCAANSEKPAKDNYIYMDVYHGVNKSMEFIPVD